MVATPTAKGIRRVATTEAMLGPSQISNVADDADSLINQTVLVAADLPPAVECWVGQTVFVKEDSSLRVWSGSSWIVISETHLRNLDASKVRIVSREQSGFGMITGNATLRISESVTFPVAYSSIPVVVVSNIGYRATGAYNISGLSLLSPLICSASSTTTTSTTITIENATGGALAASLDFYYNWYAIGTV